MAGAITALMTGAAYRQSARIAAHTGPFPGYPKNREPMLEVMRMHRAAVESMFGVVQQGDEIALRPCLPTAWDEAAIVLSRAGRKLRVAIVRVDGAMPPAPAGTRDLGVGERLRWSALPPESSWRIVLASPTQRIGGPSAKADAPVG